MSLSTPALVLVLGLAGCVGELTPLESAGDDDIGGPDGGGVGSEAGRTFFTANIEPMVTRTRPKGACVTCHQGTDAVNGPDFLGTSPTTHYDTLVVNTRLVGATPAESIFVTKPDHDGNALCTGVDTPYAGCLEDEVTKAGQWIMLEAAR